jgi:hypothetical protein
MAWLFSLFFIKFQVVSIGFRSGEFQGQSMTSTGWVLRKSLILFTALHGEPFSRKCVLWWIPMKGRRWSSRTQVPFAVYSDNSWQEEAATPTGSRETRPHHQPLAGRFTVSMVYVRLVGLLTLLLIDLMHQKVLWSLYMTVLQSSSVK